MSDVSIHAGLVHIPLGLGIVLPFLALGFAWGLWKRVVRRRAWLVIVMLQMALLASGILALRSGHREAPRVEANVPESALEIHEEYAEQFTWATGITLAMATGVFLLREERFVRGMTAMTVLATCVVAIAGVRVGHAGGELVYVHNAAAGYSSSIGTSAGKKSNLTKSAKPQSQLATAAEDD